MLLHLHATKTMKNITEKQLLTGFTYLNPNSRSEKRCHNICYENIAKTNEKTYVHADASTRFYNSKPKISKQISMKKPIEMHNIKTKRHQTKPN
jgi:hypothetical protein